MRQQNKLVRWPQVTECEQILKTGKNKKWVLSSGLQKESRPADKYVDASLNWFWFWCPEPEDKKFVLSL